MPAITLTTADNFDESKLQVNIPNINGKENMIVIPITYDNCPIELCTPMSKVVFGISSFDDKNKKYSICLRPNDDDKDTTQFIELCTRIKDSIMKAIFKKLSEFKLKRKPKDIKEAEVMSEFQHFDILKEHEKYGFSISPKIFVNGNEEYDKTMPAYVDLGIPNFAIFNKRGKLLHNPRPNGKGPQLTTKQVVELVHRGAIVKAIIGLSSYINTKTTGFSPRLYIKQLVIFENGSDNAIKCRIPGLSMSAESDDEDSGSDNESESVELINEQEDE